MAQLWNKGYNVNKEILEFTVGNDHQLDQLMIKHDILGSIAQGAMLKKIGVLTASEWSKLHKALLKVLKEWEDGKFVVQAEQEDGHTAIEQRLVELVGDLGKKIHTARSRNDQVVTMTRLYVKDQLQSVVGHTLQVAQHFITLAKKYQWVPMPGYTHMQRAMPASGGMWFQQYADALLDDLRLVQTAYDYNDMSPLGSAAGFGVNLNIDRAYTAKLMGFKRVQANPMYVSYTRGKVESTVLFALNQLMGTLAKFANDVLLFSMSETGFVELPKEFCTGSSLMPQKKNGDVFELTRGKVKVMLGYVLSSIELQNTLLSGYNRDSQLSKDILVKGLQLFDNTIKIMNVVVPEVRLNKAKCIAACTAEVFATDYALDLVKQGMPFRDAYRHVGTHLEDLEVIDPETNIRSKIHLGATGNLALSATKTEAKRYQQWLQREHTAWQKTVKRLLTVA